MSDSTNRYIVAYDIADDKRRARVANFLKRFGVRAQFSVFIVDLRPTRMVSLRSGLESIINGQEDSVMVCRLGAASRIERDAFQWLGRRGAEPPLGPIIV